MDDLPVSLDELIATLERRDADPLQLLTDAVIASGRLDELGDELVGHFVKKARDSGASWADVGQSMGVSKQAAQKRFVDEKRHRRPAMGGLFTRFTGEARMTVQTAVGLAQHFGSTEVNTLHLVIALAKEESGRAYVVLSELTGSTDDLAAAAERSLETPSRSRKAKHLPFMSDAKKVLELSLREAIREESRHIGTEHILLGLLRDRSAPGAAVLIDHGVTYSAVETWLEENPVSDR